MRAEDHLDKADRGLRYIEAYLSHHKIEPPPAIDESRVVGVLAANTLLAGDTFKVTYNVRFT